MDSRAVFFVRFDGSVYGCVARLGQSLDFDRDFLDRCVFVACNLAVDGVPRVANPADDFYILSDYLDSDDLDGIYCDTGIVAENVARA